MLYHCDNCGFNLASAKVQGYFLCKNCLFIVANSKSEAKIWCQKCEEPKLVKHECEDESVDWLDFMRTLPGGK